MMRLGIVPFMNLKPLIGLYEKSSRWPEGVPVELVYDSPSRLCPMLLDNQVDASFIASVDYLRHRDRFLLETHFGVATRAEVASVLLLSRGPVESIKRICVDERSSTSVAMLRVLLHHKFRISCVLEPGDVTGSTSDADAVLVIGDRALEGFTEFDRIYDIGTEWTSWTGLPFIFGVWVTKEPRFLQPLEELLAEGWRWTNAHWEEVIRDEAGRTGFNPELVEVYLQENIQYTLGPKEFEGLARFAELFSELEPISLDVEQGKKR
jgi:chorismate dehydratase